MNRNILGQNNYFETIVIFIFPIVISEIILSFFLYKFSFVNFSSVPMDHNKCDRKQDDNSNQQNNNNNNNAKKTFSIEDILKPKALKLHPGIITNTSPSISGIHGNTAGYHSSQVEPYGLSINTHGKKDQYDNRGIIHPTVGTIPASGFTSVIKEHVHRQEIEPPVHQRDSQFHSFSPYIHDSLSKEKDNYHKRQGSGFMTSGLRKGERFRWEENTSRGREAWTSLDNHQESDQHRDRERERQDRESSQESGKEHGSPGRSSQPSPVESASSASSCGSAVGERQESGSPLNSKNYHWDTKPDALQRPTLSSGSPVTTEHHHSPSEVEYLGLPAIPQPTYPALHQIPLQPLPGVCLPLPQVSDYISSKKIQADLRLT